MMAEDAYETAEKTVDARGLSCPFPVLGAGKALRAMQVGERLHLIASDPRALDDIPGFCAQTGHRLEGCRQDEDGTLHFLLHCRFAANSR